MKSLLTLVFFLFLSLYGSAQTTESKKEVPTDVKNSQIVEAACGQCKFGLKGKGCDLAVRVDGKAYFVDGTAIDDHGDAHASDGFCNAIRKAEVKGKVEKDRFKASYFKLVKAEEKTQK